ncbi:hypothetical protein CHH27_20120 [Labrenzia sp. VG12]|nr:hypothetical protein CHH27_20120 [Labrenzia sp. VG12]
MILFGVLDRRKRGASALFSCHQRQAQRDLGHTRLKSRKLDAKARKAFLPGIAQAARRVIQRKTG